jgi:hypothetical protein
LAAPDYGRFYFGVRLNDSIVYAHADNANITESGGLVLIGKRDTDGKGRTVLAFNAGEWRQIWAASVIDGDPVAVEHWDSGTSTEPGVA